MTSRIGFAAAGVLALSTILGGQAHPDFSGTWEPRRAISPPPHSGGGGRAVSSTGLGANASWIVVQTPASLSVTLDFGDGSSQKWLYRLDGSESANKNARTTQTTRSRWVDSRLVTEGTLLTVTETARASGTFKETRWLDKEGLMHVETTQSSGGNAPATSESTFARRIK